MPSIVLADHQDLGPQVTTTDQTSSNQARFASYMDNLQRKVKNVWNHPKPNECSKIVVIFTIYKDGHIGNLKLDRSSSDDVQDKAALKAVQDASPFSPLPEGTPSADAQLTLDLLTDEMMIKDRFVFASKDHRIYLFDKANDFSASFNDEVWTKGMKFTPVDLRQHFIRVTDPQEVFNLIYVAHKALGTPQK